MRRKMLSILCAIVILLANVAVIPSYADYVPVNTNAVSANAEIQATGLIFTYT